MKNILVLSIMISSITTVPLKAHYSWIPIYEQIKKEAESKENNAIKAVFAQQTHKIKNWDLFGLAVFLSKQTNGFPLPKILATGELFLYFYEQYKKQYNQKTLPLSIKTNKEYSAKQKARSVTTPNTEKEYRNKYKEDRKKQRAHFRND